MSEQVPAHGLQLQTLVTASQTVEVSLTDVEVAAPGPHQVVVRIEAAPMHEIVRGHHDGSSGGRANRDSQDIRESLIQSARRDRS